MNLNESRRIYDRAHVIPGRSLTRSKAPGRLFPVDAGPLYVGNHDGALIYDVDGNEYIDMLCGLGAISLGGRGFLEGPRISSLPHRAEVEAAERVLRDVAPWATHCRFTKTGSEATHAAYRIAKRATGRDYVLIGDWAYHGWHEWCEWEPLKTGEGRRTIMPTTVPYRHGMDFSSYPPAQGPFAPENRIAAVFVEPHRWEPVQKAWLQQLRAFCDRTGALLVFDEMIYGGRFALGGATEMYGVKPNLACFGKAIGNGAPIACVVGGDVLRDHGEVASGTYSGDVPSLRAVLETLHVYRCQPVIAHLWEVGERLRAGLLRAVTATNMLARAWVEGNPVHLRLRFQDDDADMARGKRFASLMTARNVLWHPACANVCYAHTARQIDAVIEAARASLAVMREEL